MSADDLDPAALMWFWRTHLRNDGAPRGAAVIEVDFTDVRRRFWLVSRDGDVDLCLKPPGFDPDVSVRGDTRSLVDVYLARRTIAEAIRDGSIEVDGSRQMIRALPDWLHTTNFARNATP